MKTKDFLSQILSTKETDVEKAGLSGPVKQVKQICYKAHRRYGQIKTGKVQHSEYKAEKNFTTFYDENGHKTEEQIFSPWSRNKIVYNEMGLPTEETHYFMDGDVMDDTSKVMNKTIKKYDANGNMLEQIQFDSDGKANFKIISKFADIPRLKIPTGPVKPSNIDGHGSVTEQYCYNEDKLTGKTTWVYNEKGLLLENTTFDLNDLPTIKCIWKYDDKDNMIEVAQYNSEGVLTSKCSYEIKYDKHGNKIGYTSNNYYSNDIPNSKSIFKCNEQGDVIEANHFDENGNLAETRVFTPKYDELGNLINPWEEDDEKLKSETEECKYDSHDNWISKTTYYASTSVAWRKVPVHQYFREITYWGEENTDQTSLEKFYADIKIQHDIDYNDDDETNKTEKMKNTLTSEQAQWLVEASTADNFNFMRYYTLVNKEAPSVLIYSGPYIEAIALLNELKDNMDANIIHSYSTSWNAQGETMVRYTLIFPEHPEYMLHATQISSTSAEEFEIPDFITDHPDYGEDDDCVHLSAIELLRPSDASGKRGKDINSFEREFENEIEDYISKCMLQKQPDKPTINIIEVRGNGFAMVEHAVNDDFEIKDLDLNYGEGFTSFHNELMSRFNTQTKGLVLFHGEPGTGKTYYIRHLLRKMTSNNKAVIYMPPNIVEYLMEPNFMTFLNDEVSSWAEYGIFTVLLIEDAEPLLASRQHGARIQGITNLLNMSDGLLNDMLNMQIICTFNVELAKLDTALLRPGRLIARKEFCKLPEFEANLLAQRLGIKHHFNAPATLSEIYAKAKNQNTLIHDVDERHDFE